MTSKNLLHPSIKGYKIVGLLGQGGMASVYRAIENTFKREVALKVISEKLSIDEEIIKRFQKEAEVSSRLSHKNIVPIFSFGQEGSYHFIEMEYMRGKTLKDKLKQGLDIQQGIFIIKEIASALDYLNENNVVHRDIKPENILFRENDNTPLISDFGIVQNPNSDTTRLTKIEYAHYIGTPYYMSPERFLGKALDYRSDLYSLGVMFYVVLTGVTPFRCEEFDYDVIAHMHKTDPVPSLPTQVRAFQKVVNKILAKSPDDRYQSGRDFVDAINKIKFSYKGLTNKSVQATFQTSRNKTFLSGITSPAATLKSLLGGQFRPKYFAYTATTASACAILAYILLSVENEPQSPPKLISDLNEVTRLSSENRLSQNEYEDESDIPRPKETINPYQLEIDQPNKEPGGTPEKPIVNDLANDSMDTLPSPQNITSNIDSVPLDTPTSQNEVIVPTKIAVNGQTEPKINSTEPDEQSSQAPTINTPNKNANTVSKKAPAKRSIEKRSKTSAIDNIVNSIKQLDDRSDFKSLTKRHSLLATLYDHQPTSKATIKDIEKNNQLIYESVLDDIKKLDYNGSVDKIAILKQIKYSPQQIDRLNQEITRLENTIDAEIAKIQKSVDKSWRPDSLKNLNKRYRDIDNINSIYFNPKRQKLVQMTQKLTNMHIRKIESLANKNKLVDAENYLKELKSTQLVSNKKIQELSQQLQTQKEKQTQKMDPIIMSPF